MPRHPSSVASSTLTSWLLTFAVAVLLFGIVSIALFDRMHASLKLLRLPIPSVGLPGKALACPEWARSARMRIVQP
jgi:hypothetical protein